MLVKDDVFSKRQKHAYSEKKKLQVLPMEVERTTFQILQRMLSTERCETLGGVGRVNYVQRDKFPTYC